MTPSEVLALAKEALRLGKYQYTFHVGDDSMPLRNVGYGDIKRAIKTATGAVLQRNGSWRLVGGVDTDDEGLIVAVAIHGRTFHIITVFHG